MIDCEAPIYDRLRAGAFVLGVYRAEALGPSGLRLRRSCALRYYLGELGVLRRNCHRERDRTGPWTAAVVVLHWPTI